MVESLEVDDRIFNPIYLPMLHGKADVNILWGGRNSGKSEFIQQKIILSLLSEKNRKVVVIRDVYDTHKDSTFKTFEDIIDYLGLGRFFKTTVSPLRIQCLINGNDIIFRGCDNPGKLKGLRGRNCAFFEEVNQISEEAYDIATTSLRSVNSDVEEYHALNPESDTMKPEDYWYYKRFFSGSKGKETFDTTIDIELNGKRDSILIKVIHSVYPDNNWCSLKDAHKLEMYQKTDPYRYRVWCKGKWAPKEVKMPYMNSFDEKINVSTDAVFVKGRRIVFSFDFNVDNCACVCFHFGVDFIHGFDEILAKDLPSLLDKLHSRYSKYLSTCMITGDRSGKSRHHLQRDENNSYRMIKSRLKLKDNQFKVIVNPTHKDNRFTCNTIVAYHDNVIFHPDNCKNTIFDMSYVECDQNESIIKKDRNIANQKADLLDAVRYFFNTFKAYFVKDYLFE